MNYGDLYHRIKENLGSAFEAGQLITHVTGERAADLHLLKEKEVSPAIQKLVFRLCTRRQEGEPLQYLLGEWEFYGLPFKVGKGVLIPRADTETLVETAAEKIKQVNHPQILDLCSGSGCIAIALAFLRSDALVTALELSGAAFGFLTANIDLNRSSVKAVQCDLRDYTHPSLLDLIVSNPPYIPRGHLPSLQKEVGHEPVQALDGGMDGLDFYRAIARRYHPQLKPGGWICFEVGIGQSAQVADILSAEKFSDIGVQNDYNGIARVVFARKL